MVSHANIFFFPVAKYEYKYWMNNWNLLIINEESKDNSFSHSIHSQYRTLSDFKICTLLLVQKQLLNVFSLRAVSMMVTSL